MDLQPIVRTFKEVHLRPRMIRECIDMPNRYPTTIHIAEDMAKKIDQTVDPAVISSRPGGGNTTQSFLKGDIIADQLNVVFGPLGWGIVARIHQMDDWEEEKTVTRNNQQTKVGMRMVQVVSDVTLTIKKTTPDGTDTVFTQPGIGYGEAEEGKSRKEAFSMAVKGAATDGLKRCASLVGKAFGMMMASNGSQQDIEYAHNGKQQNLRKAQELRRQSENRQEGRSREGDARGGDSRGNSQRQDDRQQGGRREEQRHPQEDGRGAGRDRQQGDRDRQQEDRERQSETRGGNQGPRHDEAPARREGSDGRSRQQEDSRQERGTHERSGEQVDARRTPEAGATTMERPAEQSRQEPAKESDAKDGDAKTRKRQADTNYPLDSLPITKQEMTDFGATLVERVKEMRQKSDRTSLVKQHLNTIKNLDSAIRRRVIERLREHDVDVDKIPS